MRARALVAGVAVLGIAVAISFANAATLNLTGSILGAAVIAHPCSGTATATAATGSGTTYSAVSITVPPGCASRRLDVTLLSGSTVLRSGTTDVAGSGATTVRSQGRTPRRRP